MVQPLSSRRANRCVIIRTAAFSLEARDKALVPDTLARSKLPRRGQSAAVQARSCAYGAFDAPRVLKVSPKERAWLRVRVS